MEKIHSCCFTGHRPSKLKWGYDEEHPNCLELKIKLAQAIQEKYDQGVRVFYTGMAQGTDIWAAEMILEVKRANPEAGLQLIAVLPYEEQASRWSEDWRERYFNILAECDDEVTLQGHYSQGCMQRRNRYLVDHCAHMIAVYNGSKGGTQYTVEYARKNNLDVVIIDPDKPDDAAKQIKPYLRLIK